MWLEVLSVISREDGEIRLASLSLPPSLHGARNFKGMAAGQVAMLEHKVTLRDTQCCGTDRNLCVSLGLASLGILFYERHTFLI